MEAQDYKKYTDDELIKMYKDLHKKFMLRVDTLKPTESIVQKMKPIQKALSARGYSVDPFRGSVAKPIVYYSDTNSRIR